MAQIVLINIPCILKKKSGVVARAYGLSFCLWHCHLTWVYICILAASLLTQLIAYSPGKQ